MSPPRPVLVHASAGFRAGAVAGAVIGVCMVCLLVATAPHYFTSTYRSTLLPLYLIVYPSALLAAALAILGILGGLLSRRRREHGARGRPRAYRILAAVCVPTWLVAQYMTWVMLPGAALRSLAKWNGILLVVAAVVVAALLGSLRGRPKPLRRQSSGGWLAFAVYCTVVAVTFWLVWRRPPRSDVVVETPEASLTLGVGAASQPSSGPAGEELTFDTAPRGFPPVPHILLITIDTLRADHLGCYGHPFPTSPTIDALASKSVRFDRAYSHSSGTIPSFCGLFTCGDPVMVNAFNQNALLDETVETFVERLQKAGYRTTASVRHGGLTPKRGFAQGFDHYNNIGKEKDPNLKQDDPDLVTADAIALINQVKDQPRTFHWVHYLAPHTPYEPPAEIAAMMKRPPTTDARPLPAYWFSDRNGISRKHLGAKYRDQIRDGRISATLMEELYDAEIRWTDDALGRLLQHVAGLGWDDYAILLTADHGESLGEHGIYCRHCVSLYDSQIRIPLILYWSKMRRTPGAETYEVANSDFGSTLLDLAGVRRGAIMRESPLTPFLLSEKAVWPARPIVSQTAFCSGMAFWLAGDRYDYPDWSIIENDYKYIHYANAVVDQIRWPRNYVSAWRELLRGTISADQLFQLGRDADPSDDLSKEKPEMAQRMRRALLSSPQLRYFRNSEPGSGVIDEEHMKALKTLGYIGN